MNACSTSTPGFSRIVPLQVQVLAPIHGQDGPCHCLQVPNLLQGLHLLRYLPGALLQLTESNGTEHLFSVGALRFHTCGTDANERLLFSQCQNLHQDIELIRTETRAAYDAAKESWYEWLDWHRNLLASCSVEAEQRPCPAQVEGPELASGYEVSPRLDQGEGAGGEGVEPDEKEPEQPCDSCDVSRKVKVEDLRLNFAHPEVRINALEEIDAALRGIFYVYPGLQGTANHGLAYDYLHVLLEQERARAYKPTNPEVFADISVGLNHRRAVELHQLYHQYRDFLPTGFASELDALLAPIHEWDAEQKVRQARCRKAKESHVAKGRANDGPNS